MNTHSSSVPLTDGQQAAQERLETPEGRREFWRATFSCWLGTTMEYADFALYGLAAGIIFGATFQLRRLFRRVYSTPHRRAVVRLDRRPSWPEDCHGYHYRVNGHVDHVDRFNSQLRPDWRLGAGMPGHLTIFPGTGRRGRAFRRHRHAR